MDTFLPACRGSVNEEGRRGKDNVSMVRGSFWERTHPNNAKAFILLVQTAKEGGGQKGRQCAALAVLSPHAVERELRIEEGWEYDCWGGQEEKR